MCVANTLFRKKDDKLVMHVRKQSRRQIDFVLVEDKLRLALKDIETCEDITLGSDHKALRWTMRFANWMRTRKKQNRKQKRRMVGWTPHNKDAYEQELDAEMAELKGTSKWIGQALEEKCKIIEEAILEMATKHAVQPEKGQEGASKDRLRQLMKEKGKTPSRSTDKSEGKSGLQQGQSKERFQGIEVHN